MYSQVANNKRGDGINGGVTQTNKKYIGEGVIHKRLLAT